ncbi:MAG: hotdog fold thioesterase [Deltaproteobacteria bacterium]|nr:hotdog fold thioesterase [Deltaproteobacteria bacterium]
MTKAREMDLETLRGEPLPDALRDAVMSFMEEQIPFNQYLGMKVVTLQRGRAVLELPARPEFTGDPFRPALHGGVISTLADTVGGLACFSLADVEDRASTIDLRVDYLRPGKVNTPLQAEAEIIRMGNRVAVANVVVFQEGDRAHPVAVAKGVYSMRRGRRTELPEP